MKHHFERIKTNDGYYLWRCMFCGLDDDEIIMNGLEDSCGSPKWLLAIKLYLRDKCRDILQKISLWFMKLSRF